MSYISSWFHCVFSTKERRPLITPPLRERLWPFLGGIARQNRMKAIEIGGTLDHVHVLLSLPATLSIAQALQLLKGASSKWVHETFPEHRRFRWQEKYGAFSVSVSQLDKAIRYIQGQEQHHRRRTFQEEFLALLKRHRIEYDERYLWD
ncbi:MAG: IS200/IS605 family transposase [Verrucomicrobiota bacterium]|jgi:REP element-mobilizing transposase RayT